MKKVFALLFMMVVAAVVMTSCKETLPKRFELFVNHVEKRCDSFSEDDWKKANEQFEKLVNEFQENKSSYNADEQKQIRSAATKYLGLVAKSGFKSVTDAVSDIMMQLPSFLESIGNFFKDLGGSNE